MKNYESYEFRTAERALRRGYGLCSQSAFVLEDILDRQNIDSKIVNLKGHVVVQAQLEDGKEWLLDADYGVVLPQDLAFVEKNLETVKDYYSKEHKEKLVSELVNIFRDDNEIFEPGTFDSGKFKTVHKENILYILKWALPVFGLLFGLTLIKISRT